MILCRTIVEHLQKYCFFQEKTNVRTITSTDALTVNLSLMVTSCTNVIFFILQNLFSYQKHQLSAEEYQIPD